MSARYNHDLASYSSFCSTVTSWEDFAFVFREVAMAVQAQLVRWGAKAFHSPVTLATTHVYNVM